MKPLNVNDVVTLRRDLPEHQLRRGALGTIVMVFERPTLAYEVEFCDELGRTTIALALRPEDVEPAGE
jgi:hypothetical protein